MTESEYKKLEAKAREEYLPVADLGGLLTSATSAITSVREMLDRVHDGLEKLHEDAQSYVGPFALEEPGDADVTELRPLAGRGA